MTKVGDVIRGEYLSLCQNGQLDEYAELAQSVYDSVQEEANKDVSQLLKAQKAAALETNKTTGEMDINAGIENQRSLAAVDQ